MYIYTVTFLLLWTLNFITNSGLLYAGALVQDTPLVGNGREEDSVQQTPQSSNVKNKRGVTLMSRIWALPAHQRLTCPLTKSGQPIGQSGQTFKRWLGTFCLCQALCPLVPVNWTHVPDHFKENAWEKIQVVTFKRLLIFRIKWHFQ